MLIAPAGVERLTLLTRDAVIGPCDVAAIWA
jgi:hypothetical protein